MRALILRVCLQFATTNSKRQHALELQIKDPAQISKIYPVADIEHLQRIASTAAARNISIFGHASIANAQLIIGSSKRQQPSTTCIAQLSSMIPVDSDARFFKISGHITPLENGQIPSSIHIVRDNKIIGIALVQQQSPFPLGRNTNMTVSGDFLGYVDRSFETQQHDLIGLNPDCKLSLAAKKR